MRALRPADRLGQPVNPAVRARRAEAARSVISGAAPWKLLALVGDSTAPQGAAVNRVLARRGSSLTSTGASRPARRGAALLFGGTQRLNGATGLLGGSAQAAVFVAMRTVATSGVIYVYSDSSIYYDGRKALMAVPSAAHISAAHGESAVGNRNNVFAPVKTGMRVFAATFNRSRIGAAEFAIYDNGRFSAPDAAFTNDTTGAYLTSQKSTFGAYADDRNGLVASTRGFGLLAIAPGAKRMRLLSHLFAAACGVS